MNGGGRLDLCVICFSGSLESRGSEGPAGSVGGVGAGDEGVQLCPLKPPFTAATL